MPPRPKFETYAKIDLELLIDLGVFDESRVKAFGFESGEVPMVFLYLRAIRYPKREPSLLVEFEYDEHTMVQRIGMGFAETKQGKKFYMICLASGARCSDLYLHDLRFVSRRSHPGAKAEGPTNRARPLSGSTNWHVFATRFSRMPATSTTHCLRISVGHPSSRPRSR